LFVHVQTPQVGKRLQLHPSALAQLTSGAVVVFQDISRSDVTPKVLSPKTSHHASEDAASKSIGDCFAHFILFVCYFLG